jgi:hypothetical protein
MFYAELSRTVSIPQRRILADLWGRSQGARSVDRGWFRFMTWPR